MTLEQIETILENYTLKGCYSLENYNTKGVITIEFNKMIFFQVINSLRANLGEEIRFEVIGIVKYEFDTLSEHINLSNCIFRDKVIFYNCNFELNVNFKNSEFIESVNFKNSKFKSKTRFHFSVFHKYCNFENTTFVKLVDFYSCEFRDTQQFHLTDFLDITIFSKVIFYGQVQFIYNKITEKTYISFENAIFKESFDISRANFWGPMQVWGIETKVFPDFSWLYETDNIKKHNIKQSSVSLKCIRESYRRIKQEFRKDNNNIEALRFQEYEMMLYEKELKLQEKRKKEDVIVLFFNKCSNKFGTSWSRGLGFTLFVTLIFYLLFLLSIADNLSLSLNWIGIGNFLKYFLQFLNVAIWNYAPFGIEDYILGYIILFVGRIFIGYGYYQTIQAFRKYGKN